MKKFQQIREDFIRQKIIAVKKFTVLRDGGSHMHEVLNGEECGFCNVIQDFSIHSKKNGTDGKWRGILFPPNHTNDKHLIIDVHDIEFV
jgi:hypothetical protein